MTWPFENNTNGIVKNLAKRNLKSEKRRNIMVVIAVALAAFLVCLSGLTAISITKMKKDRVVDTYEATYVRVSEENLEKLKDVTEFERVGEYYIVGEKESSKGFTGSFAYANNDMMYMMRSQMKLTDGNLPQKENEILVSKIWLSKYYPSAGVGDTVTLDISSFPGDYTISGIVDAPADDSKNLYSFMISKATLQKMNMYKSDGYFAYVHLKNVENMPEETSKAFFTQIAEKNQLRSVRFHSEFFKDMNTDWSQFMIVLGLAGIIGLGAWVVIQSIFRISINDKIKSYGQLRTIGATKKQIIRVVKKERNRLGVIGSIIGITLSVILSLIIFPKGFSISGYLGCILMTIIFCWLTICIVVHKPIKLAAKISPIEAVRFRIEQKSKIHIRKKNKKLTPVSIGMMNFKRDWKKTFSIIFSLSLSGILLLVISSLCLVQSPERLARHYFPNGDYKVFLYSENEHIDTLKNGNPLDEQLKEEILAIDGVSDIIATRKSATFEAVYNNFRGRGHCDMLTSENYGTIEKALVEGDMPKDAHDILITHGYADFGETVKPGMKINLSFGEKSIPVRISGIFDTSTAVVNQGRTGYGFDSGMMYAGEEVFRELLPDIENFDYTWDIVYDKASKKNVEQSLESIIATNSELYLSKASDHAAWVEKQNVHYNIEKFLSWLIFIFGVINLTNTTLSNQLARRQENSVLRSVGLTSKQLAAMTVYEGLGYVLCSIFISLAIGLPISIFACHKFSIEIYGGKIVPYAFPLQEMLIYILVIIGMELFLSIWTIRRQKKQSLIEQMRAME